MENCLTRKQQAFVLEYVKDHNATRAAKRAGYSDKRASEIGLPTPTENYSFKGYRGAPRRNRAEVKNAVRTRRHQGKRGLV